MSLRGRFDRGNLTSIFPLTKVFNYGSIESIEDSKAGVCYKDCGLINFRGENKMKWKIMIKRTKEIRIALNKYLINWQAWPQELRFITFMLCTAMAWLYSTPFRKLEVKHYNILIENIPNPLAIVMLFYLIIFATCGTLYALYAKRLWKSFE